MDKTGFGYYQWVADSGGEIPCAKSPLPKTTGRKQSLTNGERRAVKRERCLYCTGKFYPNQFQRRKVATVYGGFVHLRCLQPQTRVVPEWF